MRIYKPGDSVTFKSDHGSILDGTVYDSSENAVMISTHFGTYSVSKDKILSGGTWVVTTNVTNVNKEKFDESTYDIGWWDSGFDDDGDTF